MLSSNEKYRMAVDRWCQKATDEDFKRWDYELQTKKNK